MEVVVTQELVPLLVATDPLLRALCPDVPAFYWDEQPATVVRFEPELVLESGDSFGITLALEL